MPHTERISNYLMHTRDADENILFRAAYIHAELPEKDRDVVKTDILLYRRTGETPKYVTDYLNFLHREEVSHE